MGQTYEQRIGLLAMAKDIEHYIECHDDTRPELMRRLAAALIETTAELEQFQVPWDSDKPIPEDAAINASHPLDTGRHELYAHAMRMVGAKHSKGALVALVNWLLHRVEDAEKKERNT